MSCDQPPGSKVTPRSSFLSGCLRRCTTWLLTVELPSWCWAHLSRNLVVNNCLFVFLLYFYILIWCTLLQSYFFFHLSSLPTILSCQHSSFGGVCRPKVNALMILQQLYTGNTMFGCLYITCTVDPACSSSCGLDSGANTWTNPPAASANTILLDEHSRILGTTSELSLPWFLWSQMTPGHLLRRVSLELTVSWWRPPPRRLPFVSRLQSLRAN